MEDGQSPRCGSKVQVGRSRCSVDQLHEVDVPRLHHRHRPPRVLVGPERQTELLEREDERARLRQLVARLERRREPQVLVQPLAQRVGVVDGARRQSTSCSA